MDLRSEKLDLLMISGISKTESKNKVDKINSQLFCHDEINTKLFDFNNEFRELIEDNHELYDLDWENPAVIEDHLKVHSSKLIKKLIKTAMFLNPKVIGLYIPDSVFLLNLKFFRVLKEVLPNIQLFYVGPNVSTAQARADLIRGISDIVLLNQSTKLYSLFVKELLEGKSPSQFQGIIFRDEHSNIRLGSSGYSNHVTEENYKVLLGLLPAWNNDYPPFGLAHISSALKDNDHYVLTKDYNSEFWQETTKNQENGSEWENMPYWMEKDLYYSRSYEKVVPYIDRVIEDLKSNKINAIGLTIFETSLFTSIECFKLIRKECPNVKIFCGGPSVTMDLAQELFSEGLIDAAVFGEGEYSAIDIIDMWSKDLPAQKIAGTWLYNNGDILKGPSRPLADINKLPIADFSGFNVYNYKHYMLPIFFSRGCIAKCTFCYETKYWQKFRTKRPLEIYKEFERNVEEYGIRDFRINDSLMNGSHKLLEQLADLLIQNNLRINYSGYCRMDKKLTKPLLAKMKKSGCKDISFGLESASQNVLDLMKKGVDAVYLDQIVKDTYDAGIIVIVCVMVGYPGESWLDYFKTLKFLIKNRKYITTMNLSIFAPSGLYFNGDKSSPYHLVMTNDNNNDWMTQDKKNTRRVRLFRSNLARKIWFTLKNRKDSPDKWHYA